MEENKNFKFTVLQINNKEYEISLNLSFGEIMFIARSSNENKKNCNMIIATIITNHVIDKSAVPSKESVATDEEALETYIDKIVAENVRLKQSYDKFTQEPDKCIRFILAAKDMWSDMTRPIHNNIAEINFPLVQTIGGTAFNISSQIGSTLSGITGVVKESFSELQATMLKFQQAIEPINRISEKFRELLSGFSSQLSSLFEHIKIPNISDERKEEMRVNFERWGKLGWTLMPHADLTTFDSSPANIEEANDIIKNWCTKEDIELLFRHLHNVKGVKKYDLEEAICLYHSRQYKPCAMVLFSLIDSKLIRMQRKEDRNPKNNRRYSGATAIKKIKKRVEKEQDINKTFLLLLSFVNLFACIEVFFKDAGDFKIQPELINRNFLQHGMLTRKVKKRDCIQLFLLYYNFLEFFEIINS